MGDFDKYLKNVINEEEELAVTVGDLIKYLSKIDSTKKIVLDHGWDGHGDTIEERLSSFFQNGKDYIFIQD